MRKKDIQLLNLFKCAIVPFGMVIYLGMLMILDITKSETMCTIFEFAWDGWKEVCQIK